MKREKSAGFVVFRRRRGGTEYLLLQNSSKFFWDFPKGLMDEKESEIDAARRELKEEAGLSDIKIVPGFRASGKYMYRFKDELIDKEIVMFLAEAFGDEVTVSWEHSRHEWLPYDEAVARLKDKKREILEKAHRFLTSKLENWTK
jgi:8-oxo-dGTP pyrophosphatase MutT (NUDIX family)